MKKIIGGILGIFVVIGIVAGTGYALFSSQVTMTGMVLGTATPGLKISFYLKEDPLILDWESYRDYQTNLPFADKSFQLLLPGESDWGAFWLKNESIAGNPTTPTYDDPLDLRLSGRITAVGGEWNDLKNVVQMRVCVYKADVVEDRCDPDAKTEWMTLNTWYLGERDLPGILESGENREWEEGEERLYVINFKVPSGYDNTISGKTISGMTMRVTGTQITP